MRASSDRSPWTRFLARILVAVLLVNHVCANKKQSLHFSDFYHIMDKEDSDAYNERLREIMEWGLRNVKAREPHKGPLQAIAEDLPFVPGAVRQGLKKVTGGFKDVTARRQKRLDAQLQKEREKIEKGLARSGFLVAYYMYNHDGDAAREGFLWRPPKARPLIPYGKGSVRRYLRRLQNRKFNHMYVGVTQEFEPYGDRPVDDWLRTTGFEGFKVLSSRVLLGKGPDVYARAKRKIATWGLNDSVGWVKFIEGEDGLNVASRIKAYGLVWTLNPLRKVLCHEKPWGQHGGGVAAVAVSTLQGHLLKGEERFSVCYEGAGGNVYFDMLSFSKGSFPLGALVLPLIRPLQGWFFKDMGRAMQKAVLLE